MDCWLTPEDTAASTPILGHEQDPTQYTRDVVSTVIATGTLAGENNGLGISGQSPSGGEQENKTIKDSEKPVSRWTRVCLFLDACVEQSKISFQSIQVFPVPIWGGERGLCPSGCGRPECLGCGRNDSFIVECDTRSWSGFNPSVGRRLCVKTSLEHLLQSLTMDGKLRTGFSPIDSRHGTSFSLPSVIYFPESGFFPAFEFMQYQLPSAEVGEHLMRRHFNMVAAIMSVDYVPYHDLRWLAISAGIIRVSDYHTINFSDLLSLCVEFSTHVPRSWLCWLPWFDVCLFTSVLVQRGFLSKPHHCLFACARHGTKMSKFDVGRAVEFGCKNDCFLVPDALSFGNREATMLRSGTTPGFGTMWADVAANVASVSCRTPLEPSMEMGGFSVGNSGSSSSSSSSSSVPLSSTVCGSPPNEEEREGDVPSLGEWSEPAWDDYFVPVASAFGVCPGVFKDVGDFIKQKFGGIRDSLSAVSSVMSLYNKVKTFVNSLGITKKHVGTFLGLVLAFIFSMFVKKLVKRGIAVKDVIVNVCDVVGDGLGEFLSAVKTAFGFFEEETKHDDALSFELRDGKYVFSQKPPRTETSPDVRATSAQIISAVLGGAMATTLPSKKPLKERVLEGVKLIVPLVAAAGVCTQAVYWIFTKLPSSCGVLVQKVVGVNPATRGNARMYELMSSAAAMTIKFRDAKPEELTVEEAKSYIGYYNDILCLIVSSTVAAPALVSAARGLMTDMQPFVELCKIHLGDGDSRVTPLGLYIYGKPGIGKSSVAPMIAKGLFPNREASERMYTKNLDSAYWEGYKAGTPMLYFDEPHAAGGQTVEAFNTAILSMISNAAFTLNYANCTEKGKVKLAVSVVAISANIGPTAEVKGLVAPEAFRRRMMYWEVVLLPEYADESGVLDTKKIAHFTEQERVDMAHLRFVLRRVTNLRTGETDRGTQYCLADMITIIKGKLAEHESNYNSLKLVSDSKLTPQQLEEHKAVEAHMDRNVRAGLRVMATGFGDEEIAVTTQVEVKEPDVKDLCGAVVGLKEFPPRSGGPIVVNDDGTLTINAAVFSDFMSSAYPDWLDRLLDWSRILPAVLYNNLVVRSAHNICLRMGEEYVRIGREERGGVVRVAVSAALSPDGDFGVGKIGLHLATKSIQRAVRNSPWFLEAVEKASAYDKKRGIEWLYGRDWEQAGYPEQKSKDSAVGQLLEFFNMTPNFRVRDIEPWIEILLRGHYNAMSKKLIFMEETGNWEFKNDAVQRAIAIVDVYERSKMRYTYKWKQHAEKIRTSKVYRSAWELFLASWAYVGELSRVPAAKLFGAVSGSDPKTDEGLFENAWTGFKYFSGYLLFIDGLLLLAAYAIPRMFRPHDRKLVMIGDRMYAEIDPKEILRGRAVIQGMPIGNTTVVRERVDDVLKHLPPQARAQSHESDDRDTVQEMRYISKEQMDEMVKKGYISQQTWDAWDNARAYQEAATCRLATSGLVLPKKIRDNQFRLSFKKNGEEFRYMYGVGLVGGVALLPSHFFRATGPDGECVMIKEELQMEFVRGKVTKTLCFEPKRVVHWADETGVLDLVAYDFGMTVNAFADIRGYIKDYDHVSNAASVPALFCKKGDEDTLETARMNLQRVYYSGQNNSSGPAETYIGNYWSYSLKSYGDCGAVLFSEEFGFMGLHTAIEMPRPPRHNGVGLAVRISKKIVDQFLSKCQVIIACCAPSPEIVDSERMGLVIGDSTMVGQLISSPAMPLKNTFKSLPYAQEEWASNAYLPAAFGDTPSQHRRILEKSYAKLCRSVKHFPQRLVDAAERNIIDLFNTQEPFEKPRLLTDDEVLNGGLPHLACMDVHTSAGSQFRHMAGRLPGKKAFLGENKPYSLINPAFNDRLQKSEKLLSVGVMPDFLSDYSLKAEMRSKDRVIVGPGEIPSSRGINVSPLDETLLMRKYFGHFINFMHTTRMEMCIGMNVFSNDWNAMILDLLRVSPVGFAMDYSGHETNSTSQMFESFHRVVEEYYCKGDSSPEHSMMRRRLLYGVCYHLTRIGNNVMLKNEHLMSGSVITAIMNSFVTMMHFRIAFLVLGRGKEIGSSLHHFNRVVCLKVYGDDNVASVAATIPWFNPANIQKVMEPFGIVMTMADKVSAVTENFDSVLDLQFLKCTSRRGRGEIQGVEFFPVVEEASIVKSLMATSSKIDLHSIVLALGNDSLSRVWSSGSERFALWRKRIWKVWKKIGLLEIPISWDEVEQRWYQGTVVEWATFAGFRVPQLVHHAPRIVATADVPLTPAVELETTNLVETKVADTTLEISSFDSIGPMLKRMIPVHRFTGQLSIGLSAILFGYPKLSMNSLFRYYSAMFQGFVGDLTLYVVPDDPNTTVSISFSGDSLAQNPEVSAFNHIPVSGPMMRQRGSLLVRCPCLTAYNYVKTPLSVADVDSPACFMGRVRITGVSAGTLYACLSDGARFFGLREIPRLTISGLDYPHPGGDEVTITEFITVIHDSDYNLLDVPSQEWANRSQSLVSDVTPSTGSGPLTTFKAKSSIFTDAQLRQLQYTIKDGQGRNYVPGNTNRYVSLAALWAAPLSVKINGVGAVVDRAQYSLPYSTYLGGSFHVIAGQRILVADEVVVNNYSSNDGKKVADLPLDRYYFRHLTSVSKTLPAEALATAPLRRMVSNEPLWCIRVLPPTILATATQFAGEVVLHTEGGLPSAARNVAVGGLIPEATTALPERPAVLGTVLWNDTDLEGSILAMYENPFDLINVKSAKPAFDASIFWSGEATLHLKVASNPALAGQLLIFWVPGMTAQEAAAHYSGRFGSAKLCANVSMQPNAAGVISFSAPFVHYKNAVRNSDTSDILGTFVVMVQNRLRVGPNAVVHSASLTVLGSFNQNKFSILNPRVVATGGFVSKAVTNNYNLSHVANAAIDASGAADSFRGGDTTLSNDRPFISLTAPTVLPQTYVNLASSQDVNSGSRLDLMSAGLPQIDPRTTGAVKDEMSLRAMRETPSFVGRFSVTTADNVGDVLFKVDLCPCFEYFSVAYGSSFDPCLMTYASTGGTFWRGDIIMDLELVSTVYHAVDLAVCSSYAVDTTEADIDTATSQYTTNIHVSGPLTKLRVVFPWTSDTPLKRVCNGSYPVGGDYSMGYAMIRLLSLLQANELVSGTIDCNVYLSMRGDVFFPGNGAMDVLVNQMDLTYAQSLMPAGRKLKRVCERKDSFEIVSQLD